MSLTRTLTALLFTLLFAGCAQVSSQSSSATREAPAQEPTPRPQPSSATPPATALPAHVTVEHDPITNAVLIMRATDLDLSRGLRIERELKPLRGSGRYGPLALRVIGYYSELFGLQTPTRELQEQALHADVDGSKRVQFSQQYAGLAVWNSRLEARFDARDRLIEIGGDYLPTALLARVDRQPFIAAPAAEQVAATELDALACSGCRARLVFYPQGANPRLAYAVDINDARGDSWQIVVDAGSGEVLRKVRL